MTMTPEPGSRSGLPTRIVITTGEQGTMVGIESRKSVKVAYGSIAAMFSLLAVVALGIVIRDLIGNKFGYSPAPWSLAFVALTYLALCACVPYCGIGRFYFSEEILQGEWRVFGLRIGRFSYEPSEVEDAFVRGRRHNRLYARFRGGKKKTLLFFAEQRRQAGSGCYATLPRCRCFLRPS